MARFVVSNAAVLAAVVVLSGCAAHNPSPRLAGKYGSWSLVTLEDAARTSGAVCLDGTASAYHWEKGSGDGANKWTMFFQGGGWCTSLEDCAARSKTARGSSSFFADDADDILESYDGGAHGFLSNSSVVNSDFYNWNKVYVRYCDGGSWAGDVEEPVPVGNTTIFFRGGRILDALLQDLLQRGLRDASDFVVGGSSAGGLAVLLHLDYVRASVPPSVRVVGVPQSGLFLDLSTYTGAPGYTPIFQQVFEMQGMISSGKLNQDCMDANRGDEWSRGSEWRCFIGQYASRYVRTPFFLVNSFYDYWQSTYLIQLSKACVREMKSGNQQNCEEEELEAMHGFRDAMFRELRSMSQRANSYYVYSCVSHSAEFDHDSQWVDLTVGGRTLRDAFGDWYFRKASVHLSDQSFSEPQSNPTCGVSLNVPQSQVAQIQMV